MKSGPFFVIGLFVALATSWVVFVIVGNAQLGGLTPYFDETEGNAFPQRSSGVAAQGELVYMDLGCASCHTQQIRRPDFGSDQARGWGERQSVARDYIFQVRPQLGSLRYGPDLTNLAARQPVAPQPADLMKLLYVGSATHPKFPFLFETKPVVGQRSARALNLEGRAAPRRGMEVVPSRRAEALVAYLLSMNHTFEYPEARPAAAPESAQKAAPATPAPAAAPATGAEKQLQPEAPAAPAAGEKKAEPAQQPFNTQAPQASETSNPPGKRPEQAVPAAAPDEKKKQEAAKGEAEKK